MDIYNIANQMKLERKTIYDLKIKVTFYARVSTKKDEQENSIESQILFFTQMIENNDNWTFVDGYIDRIRGESAENRKEFLRMIEDGKSGKFDLVLTKEVSRFARNTIDSLTYTRDLLRAGVGVFFQNDNICTIDTDSELRLTIMSSIAADEVRKLSERIRWGHKRSIEKGHVIGNNRIFGYDKEKSKLTINEEEATMVRLIFDLYATGNYSVRGIENVLYEKGYKGRNGTRIHHNTVSGIIQNPKYKGYYCGNKTKVIDYRTREQIMLPEKEWVMYKDETGTVPAIVSEELWNKCNEIFKERSQAVKDKGRSLKNRSVFTGKIWCAAHNKPYWRTSFSNSRSKGKSVYQWICSEKKRYGASTCSSFTILESELYSMLPKLFKDISENLQDYIKTFLEIYSATNIEENTNKQIEILRKQLLKENNKRDKLLELYMDDSISKTEFTKRNSASSSIIEDLEQEIKNLETKNNSESNYINSIKKIENYFLNMYNKDSEMTEKQIDEMSNTIIDKIYVIPVSKNSMKLEIYLKTGDSHEIMYNIKTDSLGRRSGHITKNILPKHRQNFIRNRRTLPGHSFEIFYDISICF